MDRLDFDMEVKFAADGDGIGTIEGYASVFGLMDRGGDIVAPGAFKASLAEWKRKKALPPMLWQHNPNSPIGVWNSIEEDEKGLKVTGQLIMEIRQASDVRALIGAGAVKGLSIGYITRDYEIDRKTGARTLKKVDLWEISPVTFPMLPEAQISGVKSEFEVRDLERKFRAELNLSSQAAAKAVALVKQHLRDGGEPPEPADRDGLKQLLMSLRKADAALR